MANWLLKITGNNRNWDFGLCYLYLRNVRGYEWNHWDSPKSRQSLKELANGLMAQHTNAASSTFESLDKISTISEWGITCELARCLSITNVVELPDSVMGKVSGV